MNQVVGICRFSLHMALVIPNEILEQADLSADELLVELACFLYHRESLSFGQARALSKLNQQDFQSELGKRGVEINYSLSDYEQDLKNLGISR